jgi:hypothetical protein
LNSKDKALWLAYSEVGDYFARLGGSGRWQGFSEHYIPTFVLLIALRKIDRKMAGDFDHFLPPQMWEATNNLSERISGIIGEMDIQKFSDLRGFINFVSTSFQDHPRELAQWQKVVDEIEGRWEDKLESC